MKKDYLIILAILIFILPIKVFASGGFSVSPTSINLYPGESTTITINTNNAVGQLNISSNNSAVAAISSSSIFIQTPGANETIMLTAGDVGTATILVTATANFSTMDEEILEGQTKKIIVNVISKPSPQPSTPTPTPSAPTQPNNKLSTNNNIKYLQVEGYKLIKEDDNNYSLCVSNSVSSIVLTATAEDAKSSVIGAGEKSLQVGENLFQIIIKAESGAQNIINVKVIRKDGYYLEDLDQVLENEEVKEIFISYGEELTKDQVDKIKNSKKRVELSFYNVDKQKMYGWILDGRKFKESTAFNTKIEFESKFIDEIKKESNYAEGIALSFSHNGEYPEATVVKVFVGNNFNYKAKVNLYYFDIKTKGLNFVENLEVDSDGYIEFPVSKYSDFYITKSQIENVAKDLKTSGTKGNVIVFVLFEVLQIGIIAFLIVLVIKNKKQVLFAEAGSVSVPVELESVQASIDNSNTSISVQAVGQKSVAVAESKPVQSVPVQTIQVQPVAPPITSQTTQINK